jgi:hypothetical protein
VILLALVQDEGICTSLYLLMSLVDKAMYF